MAKIFVSRFNLAHVTKNGTHLMKDCSYEVTLIEEIFAREIFANSQFFAIFAKIRLAQTYENDDSRKFITRNFSFFVISEN